jgi:phospholipid/cholesterol/gamma-HCH transport system permease protein
MTTHTTDEAASLALEEQGSGRVARLSGPLTLLTTPPLWRELARLEAAAGPQTIDVSAVPNCDTAGATLLVDLGQRMVSGDGTADVVGASEQVDSMLSIVHQPLAPPPESGPADAALGMVDTVGDFASNVVQNAGDTLEYIGGLAHALATAVVRPATVRWRDTFNYMSQVGANALGIVCLINALMGLILAFQMASQLQAYGADVYVADIVGLSITRELGPLMTAIIIAGRTGSAFAAEIGTMKVNEEVAALDAMGLDRVRFLVLPKVLALLAMMPILIVFADIFGVLGGLVVGVSFLDLPVSIYLDQTISRIELWDVFQGMIRAECYAVVIAAVGCLRGLQTRQGASGVGSSTTSAVVSGILLVILTNAVLAVVFYYVG